ncbi:MAG TPA: hypothetical protein VD815_10745 [Candidatus Saccharimonadales bacterium]|nr:hypothetical protein [Candidatus Saccharimonadales bacterium]
MKSNSIAISQPVLIILASFIFIFIFSFEHNSSYSLDDVSQEKNITLNSVSENPMVLLNTTSVSECLPSSQQLENNSSVSLLLKERYLKGNQTAESNKSTNTTCKIINVSEANSSCFDYYANLSAIPCDSQDSDESVLSMDNFDNDGLLIMNTKYNTSYNFEVVDSVNSSQIIGVNLDLEQHTQSNNNNLNSPRIEVVRKDNNDNDTPNMSAAKNQEIIWQGNIKDFFKETLDQYQNETYIAIQFNTGRHGSNIPNEEHGLGVLFDVSSSSDPYLFEYRDGNEYTKYNFESIKGLAGDDFVFHNVDENNNPVFLNNLTNKEQVKLKVFTALSDIDNAKRIVKTFVDTGTGVLNPYWSLKDVSKLKTHESIINDDEFIETIEQGSGYTIARTDNIDTRLSAFHSFVFGV